MLPAIEYRRQQRETKSAPVVVAAVGDDNDAVRVGDCEPAPSPANAETWRVMRSKTWKTSKKKDEENL